MPSKFVRKSLLIGFVPYLVVTGLRCSPPGIAYSFSISDGSVDMRHGKDNVDPFSFSFCCCFLFQSCLMS